MNVLSRPSRTPLRLLVATTAALTLSLGAYAAGMQGAGPTPGSGPSAAWHPHHHHGGLMMEKQLADLHARLKLTPEQDKLWQAALDTMKRDRAAERVDHEKVRAQLKPLMQQPILDMNALHAAHMQAQQDGARLHEETSTAWLAAYNALDDQQKTVVSDTFRQHFAKMESMRERMHQRWQQRRGGASEAAPANP